MANRVFRSRSPQAVGRGPRRKTLWIGVAIAQQSVTAAGGTIFNSLNAAALALRPFTVVRSRFTIMVRSDQTAASEDFFGAYGIAVVSDQALAIGVTAVPTPVVDSSSDLWLAHTFFMGSVRSPSAASQYLGGIYANFDSKAMRKVEDGQDLITVTEFSGVGNGMVVASAGRILVKLH